jgi:murein peptide amidase A
MRALRPARIITGPLPAKALSDQPDPIQRLLNPLLELTSHSDYLIGGSVGQVQVRRDVYQIPRFVFIGPTGGGETIRLGIFAGFHGDGPESAEALVEFLQELEGAPQLARGFHIYAYPLCNPTGFVARTRHNVADEDLAAQFWRRSSQPEVYYLERELGVHRFHGVISVNTKNLPGGFLVKTSSEVLSPVLAPPAIQASQRFLPGYILGGVPPNDLSDALPDDPPADFLTVTDELNPAPFELHVGIPKSAPRPSQIHGTVGALKSILDSYRSLLAIGQNL